ncbi:MAG: hypothetical protein AAGI91_02470 [Bacteroidota bacterium]
MRFLRHSAIQRVLSAGLLLGLGLWLVAPATGAARPVAAPPGAPPTVEAAFEQALAAAADARTPEAFVAAFAEALSAEPDLAQFLDQRGGAELLLSILYGHLLQAFGHDRGVVAAPAPPVAAPAGGTSSLAAKLLHAQALAPRPVAIAPASSCPDTVVPLAVLSAAQPLGP